MKNMNDIVLIGKVTGSTPNLVQLEYPSISGIHSVRLPRTMLARFERIANERVAVLIRTDDSERGQQLDNELVNSHAPLHITEEQMAIVMAMENDEMIPEEFDEETDDEVPMWSSASSAPIVEAVYDGLGVQVDVPEGPFNGMLYAGGRKTKVSADWDFDPVRKPAFVMHEEGHQGTTVARVNNEAGEPSAFHIFNPLYQSQKRPAGAYLGTFSASYYPMAYRKGFNAPLAMAAEKGWPAQVIAWDEGKRAACFVDVTSSVDWDSACSALGERWQKRGFANNGDYRVGIAIYNSLDGSSAFKVQAVAERLACTNGMVMGDRATLINLKHTKGVLGNFDFEELGEKIMDVIETAAKEIIVAESMKDIQINRDTFEKLMTICERKGLITKPTVKRDDAGEVVALTRGHMWRLMGQGWTHPTESWVAVGGEDRGSLYHVYNILTGAITHKPTWTDGKTVLTGSTLNVSSFTDRLQTVHKVLGDITTKSVNGKSIEDQLEKVPLFSEILH
tara:strand:- start:2073 stop:3590 length:1518 start_codon:yes stop_codon:yes gene_type:complete